METVQRFQVKPLILLERTTAARFLRAFWTKTGRGVSAHPGRKNSNPARMGHPAIRLAEVLLFFMLLDPILSYLRLCAGGG